MNKPNRESHEMTARIREAVRDLPAAIRAQDEDEVREILMEISGAAGTLFTTLGIEEM